MKCENFENENETPAEPTKWLLFAVKMQKIDHNEKMGKFNTMFTFSGVELMVNWNCLSDKTIEPYLCDNFLLCWAGSLP